MVSRAALLVLGLSAPAAVPLCAQVARRPLVVSSLASDFVSRGYFRGTVEVYADSVVVVFDSTFVIQGAEASGLSSHHIDSISVGLGTTTPTGSWDIYSGERSLPVPDSLAERSQFSLGRQRFRMSRVPAKPLSESWVVVTVYQVLAPRLVPRAQQGTGTTYAHSDRRLFGGL